MSEIKLRIQGLVRTLANFGELKEEGKSRQEYVAKSRKFNLREKN